MHNNKKILIVEDEASIAEVLIAYAQKEGYITHHLHSGLGVIEYLKNNNMDLILLDIMLPNIDGITLCKEIRLFAETPIIMVTAKNEEIDRLLGLELGADDYICKPFSPREVMVRIKTVLRRMAPTLENISIKTSGFEMHPLNHTVTLHSKPIDLTPIEFKILQLFLKNTTRVFNRDQIINNTYLDTKEVSDRNIDTHIKNIRKKISSIQPGTNYISSVYGVGYRFLVGD